MDAIRFAGVFVELKEAGNVMGRVEEENVWWIYLMTQRKKGV